MRINKPFNRYEADGHHRYVTSFDVPLRGDKVWRGLLKCKLAHGRGYSTVVPDLVFMQVDTEWHWIQPLFFSPSLLAKHDDDISCTIHIDVAHGCQVRISFKTSDLVSRLSDGSQIFRCELTGPGDLAEYATGSARVRDAIEIPLYHHTSEQAHSGITKSSAFRASRWNIQGNVELANVNYLYLTPLDKIIADEDLEQIAMASNEQIGLLVDDGDPGDPDDVVVLKVYRESTVNRRHSIMVHVTVDQLAPMHLFRHAPRVGPVYYEVAKPFIQRVGVRPGETLPIVGERLGTPEAGPKRFDYVVIGDARTRAGLVAPYSEEDTEHILKIERPPDMSLLEFWMTFPAQDHFAGRAVELQEFSKRDPD